MVTKKNMPDLASVGITEDVIKQSIGEGFEALLESSSLSTSNIEGSVVKGIVTEIFNNEVVIDIGMKSEGRVSVSEFTDLATGVAKVAIGDEVDVFVERLDNRHNETILSREKAKREESLAVLEKSYDAEEHVTGVIFGKVKGGFTVDVQGVLAFLPGSQVDVRPIKDINSLMNTPLEFKIIKMDRKRSNLIVSRRAIMDAGRAEARDELLGNIKEGAKLDGVIKNITDYGAFVDLGGVDGLLHITDISWHRISHPSEVISVGQVVPVQVIRYNEETKRVSLGMKQLTEDPWSKVDKSYPIGAKVKGKITNITDYGAFVELESGVEGLIHVSEMSWTRKNVHPGKLVSTSQEVEVMVLEIDHAKRRISLGLKQCQANPWEEYAKNNKENDVVEGAVRSITDFGLFIALNEEIDGLIHMSDIDWSKSGDEAIKDYKKGDVIKARIIQIDSEKERVSLGIKQLTEAPEGATNTGAATSGKGAAKGDVVKAEITSIEDNGAKAKLESGQEGFIKHSDLSSDKAEANNVKVGDKVKAVVLSVSRDKVVNLSVKAHQMAQERKDVEEFNKTSNSGSATLGDALAGALDK